jgi:hypothetical protein
MESSKLYPPHGMKATVTFLPSASSPFSVAGPSAMISPADTSALFYDGAVIEAGVLVAAYEFGQIVDGHRLVVLVTGHRMLQNDAGCVDVHDFAVALGNDGDAGILGHDALDPGAHEGASLVIRGTAWRCMFEPIRARLASSFSRKGIREADTLTNWIGRHVHQFDVFGPRPS